MRIIFIALCLISIPGLSLCDGIIRMDYDIRELPKPDSVIFPGTSPKPILLIRAWERTGPGERDRTNFYVLDPSLPEPCFQKVFSGPGYQHVSFLTPLFGGYGIAEGRVDPGRKLISRDRKMFWFDILSGKVGATVSDISYGEWGYDDTEVRFMRYVGEGHPKTKLLCKYDFRKGLLCQYRLPLSRVRILRDGNTVLAFSVVDGKYRMVRMDIGKSEAEVVALPEGMGKLTGGWEYSQRLFPAGPGGRDGICLSRNFPVWDEFSLWWKPPGEPWIPVIRDVHVIRTYGCSAPVLHAEYVGDGRFAVARTVRDSLRYPEGCDGITVFPEALSVTMLTDGRTGRILEETSPVCSCQGACHIPDTWWSDGLKPPDKNRTRKISEYFESHTDTKTRGLAGTDDGYGRVCLSRDGRYLAIFKGCVNLFKGYPGCFFHITDGRTGREKVVRLTGTRGRELDISEISWETLYP